MMVLPNGFSIKLSDDIKAVKFKVLERNRVVYKSVL